MDEKIIAVKAYFLFPPPAFRSFSRIDHLIPLDLGGSDEDANLWPNAGLLGWLAPGANATTPDRMNDPSVASGSAATTIMDRVQRLRAEHKDASAGSGDEEKLAWDNWSQFGNGWNNWSNTGGWHNS